MRTRAPCPGSRRPGGRTREGDRQRSASMAPLGTGLWAGLRNGRPLLPIRRSRLGIRVPHDLLGTPNRYPPGSWKASGYDRAMRRPPAVLRAALLAAGFLLALAAPGPAAAQLFFSSEPSSPARIGPLIVRASVTPGRDTTDIDILWSVAV